MKVILVNGSPHQAGATYTALDEMQIHCIRSGAIPPQEESISTNFIR